MIHHPALRLACLLAAVQCAAAVSAQAADAYPNRPVRFVVPYPPGGTTDLIGRGIADKIGTAYGQQFVVDNRGGASTAIGAELMARARPDGYTIGLVTQTTMSINPNIRKKLPYDPVKDFAPLTMAVYFPYVIAAHPSVPFKDMKGLIAYAKSKPNTLTYATPGQGSTNHLGGAMLESMAGIKLLHVPFKGSGPATNAVLGGEVNLIITGAATVMPHAKAGRAKIIAFADEKRHPNYPDVPSTGEAGLKGYRAGTWFGIVATGGTPKDIVASLNREIVKALTQTDLKDRLTSIGFDVQTSSPEEFGKYMAEDRATIAKIIKDAGLKF